MKISEFFFDYIYYRANKCYLKQDGREGITSVIAVVSIQLNLLLAICWFLWRLKYSRAELRELDVSRQMNIGSLIALILLYVWNRKKYPVEYYDRLEAKWEHETETQKWIREVLVIGTLAVVWIPFIWVAILK